MKLIIDIQNYMKSNHEKNLIYFFNIECYVISQLSKSEIKIQLVREEIKKRNLIRGWIEPNEIVQRRKMILNFARGVKRTK